MIRLEALIDLTFMNSSVSSCYVIELKTLHIERFEPTASQSTVSSPPLKKQTLLSREHRPCDPARETAVQPNITKNLQESTNTKYNKHSQHRNSSPACGLAPLKPLFQCVFFSGRVFCFSSQTPVRPISLLRLSLPRLLDSNFPAKSL